MPPPFTCLYSTLEEIQLSLELQAACNPVILAEDFANWISRSNPGLASSKLGILCTSNFQVTAGPVLGNSFVKDFRLLIWTTTLAYTAYTADYGDPEQLNEALCNLKRLRNSYGERVVRNLDRLCRPQVIQQLSKVQRKLLFLIIVSICLSTTYTLDSNNNSVF